MKKRLLAALLSAALMLCAVPSALAANDISGHWAEKYITYLNQEGIINPNATTGKYSPTDEVTRAEFMRYINRAFHFTETTDISYEDVTPSSWYYETVRIATKYGYIAGIGNNMMMPDGFVTREQAATIIGRLYKTTTGNAVTPSQLSFTDKNEIGTWSAGYIYDAVQKGYLVGRPDGSFGPQDTITRAEIARILYAYLGTSLSEANGSYTSLDLRDDVENATISEGCILSNAEIGGDLYITEGLGSERVVLSNVSIGGTLVISGGNVTLEDVEAPEVIVASSMNRLVEVTATGNTNVAEMKVQSNASLTETALDASAGGFSDVVLEGNESTTLTLACDIWDLDMESNSTVTLANSGNINTLNMGKGGTVNGYGTIGMANITANGAVLGFAPKAYNLASGMAVTIDGKLVRTNTSVAISPGSLEYDKGIGGSANAYDFVLEADPNTLDAIVFENKTLTVGTDYRTTDDGFRLYRTFLSTITKEGDYILELRFSDDSTARLSLSIIDTSRSKITPVEATFDKYELSAQNTEISFSLDTPEKVQLSNIRVGSVILTRGDDYIYYPNTNSVTLKKEYLETRAVGNYTLSFNMSAGNNLAVPLKVVDTRPINTLSTTELEFDTNEASTTYGDVEVGLTAVDSAKLRNIIVVGGDKVLEENWQYVVTSAGNVRLNAGALASLSKDVQYVDLRFSMSSGVNPVLRVKFTTSQQVRVFVTGADNQPVPGATVTIRPDSGKADEEEKQLQEQSTDSSGLAVFYAKPGSYIARIKGEQFEESSKTFRVQTESQDVNFKVAIQESVTITVSNKMGANVSGANVTLDDQTLTTKEDGTVVFTVERGPHTLTVSAPNYKTYTKSIEVSMSTRERVILDR